MRNMIPPWREDHNEPDPNLRLTVCPVGTNIMPQDHPLPIFQSQVLAAKSKKAMYDAFIKFAFANGCLANVKPDVWEQLEKYDFVGIPR